MTSIFSLVMPLAVIALILSSVDGLRVCTNTACKTAGSRDTLLTAQIFAACSNEAFASAHSDIEAAVLQQAFSASKIESCGCLGGCGRGPNVVSEQEEIFYDVYKPKSVVALLQQEGITVPQAALSAWLKRMYAMRALRRNDPKEAVGLLTLALNEAGALKQQGATLLAHMLELRADAYEQLQDQASANSDRVKAVQMRRLILPEKKAALRA
mmetsp:Transcript_5048/g.13302  ORF Transcript_5048/g.13302 Transcript_5048/m.13302 type:complete len:212 (+) Transcript_5048:34-669(+)